MLRIITQITMVIDQSTSLSGVIIHFGCLFILRKPPNYYYTTGCRYFLIYGQPKFSTQPHRHDDVEERAVDLQNARAQFINQLEEHLVLGQRGQRVNQVARSEERRVGKECRSRWS